MLIITAIPKLYNLTYLAIATSNIVRLAKHKASCISRALLSVDLIFIWSTINMYNKIQYINIYIYIYIIIKYI